MKIKLSIKNRFTGSVLFEYEKEDNTIKETLLEALKQGCDLQGAYLRGCNLQGGDLQGAYLQGCNLQGCDLQGAYLQGCDLQGAYLQGCNLRGAYLQGCNLQRCDLQGAYLQGAYLRGCNLQGCDLQGAYLRGCDLRGCNLHGCNLRGAYLQGVQIKTAIVFTGLYEYIVIPYITEENIKRVKMGCYDRSLEDWEADFWNNNNEFPNNGSVKSNLRLMAFETAKAWFKIIEQQ